MKKLLLTLGIVLVGIACNNGQKQADKMTSKLVEKINSVCQLTPVQTSKIQPLAENFIKLRKANKDKFGSDQDAFRKANESNRNTFVDSLKSILSPDQYDKLKTFFQQQRAKNGQGGGDQENGGQE
jgi:hypothetical protein